MSTETTGILIGCIADDFTGASDIASFFTKGGLRTVLTSGIPGEDSAILGEDSATPGEDISTLEAQAVVVALKSRTQETGAAVADSLAALDWLQGQGARQLFFKYCSTFDSTPKGNIGPVVDTVLERLDLPFTILSPALPINGRTVRDGILYVNGVPIGDSHMKDHPLTPIWHSEVAELMRPQSKYPCFSLPAALLEDRNGRTDFLEKLQRENRRFTLCADCYEEAHAALIVDAFGTLPFLTGGSGLAEELARRAASDSAGYESAFPPAPGPRLLLAGSCSVATQEQVAVFLQRGGAGYLLDPDRLLTDGGALEEALRFVRASLNAGADALVYGAGSGGCAVSDAPGAAEALEQAMAELAKEAVSAGCTKLVVAGGETSGAVTQALGFQAFLIGESAAPGVPVMSPAARQDMRLVLKSGNFGAPEFFCTALADASTQ